MKGGGEITHPYPSLEGTGKRQGGQVWGECFFVRENLTRLSGIP